MATQKIDFSFLDQSAYQVELPSRGLPYSKNSPLHKGTVRVKQWTTGIEKLIDKFSVGNFFQVLADITQASVVENINVNDLTDQDLSFILYQARAYTYGSKYEVNLNCSNCGAKTTAIIDIYDFEPTFLDKFDDVFDVDVPLSLAKDGPVLKMKMKYPRVGDLIKASSLKRSDLNKSGIKIDNETYRYALCCQEMVLPNENKDVLNEETTPNFLNVTIKEIWNKLPVSCLLYITKAIDKYKHGYINDVAIKCKECGDITYIKPGLRGSFFRPSSNESGDIETLSDDIQ